MLWDISVKLNTVEAYENYLNQIGGVSLTHDQRARNYIDSVRFIHPDIEKIKNDLIGQKNPGWSFDYLKEFTRADVLNLAIGSDRLEYQIRFKLTDEAANSEHNCEVMVIYLKGDQGWYFNRVIMQSMTYDYLVPSDNWLAISPLHNCNWSASNDKKLAWKTNDWGSISYSGPGMKKLTLTSSSSYLIKSMEERPVKVRFTYMPNN